MEIDPAFIFSDPYSLIVQVGGSSIIFKKAAYSGKATERSGDRVARKDDAVLQSHLAQLAH